MHRHALKEEYHCRPLYKSRRQSRSLNSPLFHELNTLIKIIKANLFTLIWWYGGSVVGFGAFHPEGRRFKSRSSLASLTFSQWAQFSPVSVGTCSSLKCWGNRRNPENWISILETKSGSKTLANEIRIYFFKLSSRKLYKNYQMSGKINSHIFECLQKFSSKWSNMARWQRNHILLPDLTGLELKILWRPVKWKTGVKPIFNNWNPVYKKAVLPSP